MILCFYLYYLVHCGSGCAAVARSRAYVLRMIPYTHHPSRKPVNLFSSVIPNDPPRPPSPVFQIFRSERSSTATYVRTAHLRTFRPRFDSIVARQGFFDEETSFCFSTRDVSNEDNKRLLLRRALLAGS